MLFSLDIIRYYALMAVVDSLSGCVGLQLDGIHLSDVAPFSQSVLAASVPFMVLTAWRQLFSVHCEVPGLTGVCSS